MTLIFLKPLNKEKYKAKFKVIILDRRMPAPSGTIRHFQNEDWNDIYTKGFWSKNLLWNKPTIEQSIADIEKKYGVIIYR